MVAVQIPPTRVPIVEPKTGRATLAFIDFLERLWRRTGGVTDVVGQSSPPGIVLSFAGSDAPSGWLLCDGSAVSRTDYAALFSAIGSTWGSGDGSTTFNVPDLRGRVAIGVGAGAGLTARSLADTDGAETHPLTTAELATHTHGTTDGGHTHDVMDAGHTHAAASGNFVSDAAGSEYVTTAGNKGVTGANTGSSTTGLTVDSAMTGLTIDNAGSGNGHENMQPFAAFNAIIKT